MLSRQISTQKERLIVKERIIVHCSATPPSMDIGAGTIRKWHTDPPPKGNGWSGIGYNIIIRRSGMVEGGRDLDDDGDFYEEVGAHARGFNTGSIGICLIGGQDSSGTPEANFTLEQYTSLSTVIKDIQSRFGAMAVIGHRDVSDKACPSFNIQALLDNS